MKSLPLLVSGSFISPIDKCNYLPVPKALIWVGDDGLIKCIDEIQPGNDAAAAEAVFLKKVGHSGEYEKLQLVKGEFLIPGFVDTHTHAPQFPNLGAGQDYQLLEWLENVIYPMETNFKDVGFATKAYTKIVKRYINAGTTTCCYYGSLHLDATKELARIVHELGQRAFVGKCNMDRNDTNDYVEESAEQSLRDTEDLIKFIRDLSHSKDDFPYVCPVVAPRYAISTTEELLEKLRDLVDSDSSLAIQTHISENPDEIKKTKELFDYLGDEITYAGVYDYYHLLRDNTILGHAVYLEESELELIKERNAGISHCPTSNFNLTSGVAKVGVMLDRGIKVGLGTDVSGGFAPSMLTAIRNASIAAKVVALTTVDPIPASPQLFASKPLKVATLFWLATLGGAHVCNLEHKIGSLEVGKSFDAIVVNVRNAPIFTPASYPPRQLPFPYNPSLWGVGDDEEVGLGITRDKGGETNKDDEENAKAELAAMLERLLFCGDDRNMRRVYVQGSWIGGTEVAARE